MRMDIKKIQIWICLIKNMNLCFQLNYEVVTEKGDGIKYEMRLVDETEMDIKLKLQDKRELNRF